MPPKTEIMKKFSLQMAKVSANIQNMDGSETFFAPMMPEWVAKEKNLSNMVMMYSWKRRMYRAGWNYFKQTGQFVSPSQITKNNIRPCDLELNESNMNDVPEWVSKQADEYDKWVDELSHTEFK